MQSTKPAKKVKFAGRPALTVVSKMPMSTGDNAGAMGGVVSSSVMGEVKFVKGSSVVFVEGNESELLTSMTQHNKGNTMGMVVAPSQAVVFVAP